MDLRPSVHTITSQLENRINATIKLTRSIKLNHIIGTRNWTNEKQQKIYIIK